MTEVNSHELTNGHAVHGYAKFARWCTWIMLTSVIVYMGSMVSKEQSKSRESGERLFRIVHGSPIATIMCDDDGRIVEYNRAAEEMLSWSRAEMPGKDVGIMIAPGNKVQHAEAFTKAVEALKAADEDWRVTKTGLTGSAIDKWGKTIPIEFSTRGIRYGDKIEFLAFFRRVSAGAVPKVEAGPLELPKKGS